MTKSSVNKFRWISVSFCILLVACFVLFQTYRQSERDIKRFIHELEELRNKEKQSQLIQRVSKQMEEIAYQQKEISEKRRQEAVIQTHKANRMQLQAETEREKALTAQIETEKAYRLADKQKKLAIEKQQQAEHSKKLPTPWLFWLWDVLWDRCPVRNTYPAIRNWLHYWPMPPGNLHENMTEIFTNRLFSTLYPDPVNKTFCGPNIRKPLQKYSR